MQPFSPTIISSKAAENHLEKVRSEHADLLTSMIDQANKVAAFNQVRDLEKKTQVRDEQVRADQVQKTSADQANKSKELEIKKLALLSSHE